MLNQKCLVLGSSGLLGTAFRDLPISTWQINFDHAGCDITNHRQVHSLLRNIRPALVVNCAGYTNVDGAETDGELAFRVNAIAVDHLARRCAELDVVLVHFSSDYVFDGAGQSPIKPTDPCRPLNIYGASKLAGEHAIRVHCLKHKSLIIRTSGLFGKQTSGKKCFVDKIAERISTPGVVEVVVDQICAPSYARDVAFGARTMITRLLNGFACDDDSNIMHLVNGGECSWYEFATIISNMIGGVADIKPIVADEVKNVAKRPKYSVLDSTASLPSWQKGLENYFAMSTVRNALSVV